MTKNDDKVQALRVQFGGWRNVKHQQWQWTMTTMTTNDDDNDKEQRYQQISLLTMEQQLYWQQSCANDCWDIRKQYGDRSLVAVMMMVMEHQKVVKKLAWKTVL
jgi:hypothetical protein